MEGEGVPGKGIVAVKDKPTAGEPERSGAQEGKNEQGFIAKAKERAHNLSARLKARFGRDPKGGLEGLASGAFRTQRKDIISEDFSGNHQSSNQFERSIQTAPPGWASNKVVVETRGSKYFMKAILPENQQSNPAVTESPSIDNASQKPDKLTPREQGKPEDHVRRIKELEEKRRRGKLTDDEQRELTVFYPEPTKEEFQRMDTLEEKRSTGGLTVDDQEELSKLHKKEDRYFEEDYRRYIRELNETPEIQRLFQQRNLLEQQFADGKIHYNDYLNRKLKLAEAASRDRERIIRDRAREASDYFGSHPPEDESPTDQREGSVDSSGKEHQTEQGNQTRVDKIVEQVKTNTLTYKEYEDLSREQSALLQVPGQKTGSDGKPLKAVYDPSSAAFARDEEIEQHLREHKADFLFKDPDELMSVFDKLGITGQFVEKALREFADYRRKVPDGVISIKFARDDDTHEITTRGHMLMKLDKGFILDLS